MKITTDYHIHTPLSGHATGRPEEYAQHALAAGLEEIGFSDHAPLIGHDLPNVSMPFSRVPEYHRMIEDVRQKFAGRLAVRIGLEVDYTPGCEEQIAEIIRQYPYDYIIGSVHFIGDWGFDNPAGLAAWAKADVDETYRRYFALLRQSAESGLFDIIGHVDLVKKFGHRPSWDMSAEIEKTAGVFRRAGVVIEVNTAGLRKPVKEIYPDLASLKIYRRQGVPLTFGSDAHRPEEVGQDFGLAAELALTAGYKEYVRFEKRAH